MARSTGRLTHERIITVYDVFEDRDRVWVITQVVTRAHSGRGHRSRRVEPQ